MPGTGCSTAAILTRRLNQRGRVRTTESFEQFCVGQLERINRIADQLITRNRRRRQQLATRAIDKAGTELALTVRGACGSDAHPDDTEVPFV